MAFFSFALATLVVGPLIHTFVDRKPNRRTRYRIVELWLLWWLAGGGFWAMFGGLGHVGPQASEIADTIGFTHSQFQWEVGWADLAVGFVGFLCIWRRGDWMTAAVVVLAILYIGDAIGHVMQWVAHDNTDPDNIWAIPPDVLQPVVSAVLLFWYRRLQATSAEGAPTSTAGSTAAG
jgi:hypothetical protein